MSIELRHLRAYVAVAETHHVGKAAAQLHLTQPAVSRHVSLLERHIGTRLFDRTPGGMQLTPAGVTVLRQARRILADTDSLPLLVKDHRIFALHLGFMCSLGSILAPAAVRAHHLAHPDTVVTVHERRYTDLTAGLLNGELDAALLRPMGHPSGLTVDRLLTEPVSVAVPAGDALIGPGPVPLAELAGREWTVMSPHTSPQRHTAFLEFCAQAGFHPRITSTSDSLSVNLTTAAAGGGVFPCPASTPVPPGSGLVLVPIQGWTTGIDFAHRTGDNRTILDDLTESLSVAAAARPSPDR